MNRPVICRRLATVALATMISTALVLYAFAQPVGVELPAEEPTVATFAKNGTVDQVFSFAPEDFQVEYTDLKLDSILLTQVPNYCTGTLALGSVPLAVGDILAPSSLCLKMGLPGLRWW